MKCSFCNSEFPVVTSRVGRTKYCSRKCKATAMEHKIEHVCAYPLCGKHFIDKRSNPRKYCTAECFYDDRSIPIKPLPIGELERSQIEATILHYKQLVWSVSRKLYLELDPQHMTLEDFDQEGMIGLITAIQNDSGSRDEEFPGFAKYHIKMAIMWAYRYQEYTIRLPESLFRHDAQVTPEQLAQYKKTAVCISLETIPAALRERLNKREICYSPVEEKIIKLERIDELYQSLLKLPVQQRQLINEHYGLTCEATAMLQLCYKYKIARASMHRLVHRGLDFLATDLSA